jgi:hypothetical protein
MNRAAFAILIPLLVAALITVVGFDLIGLAFASEGCRNQSDAEGIVYAVREVLTVQILFFLVIWFIVFLIRKALTTRLALVNRAGLRPARHISWLLYTSFVALSLNAVFFMISCHDGTWSALGALSKAMIPIFFVTGIAGLLLVVVSYVRGLKATPVSQSA